MPLATVAATIRTPSYEQATEVQFSFGALVSVQFWAKAG
jgi:hypothetical protein